MAIGDLTTLITPPSTPNQVGTSAEWETIERELGLAFPSDFRDYITTYGTGAFARFFSIWNPYWGSKFLDEVRTICRYERESHQEFPQYFPFPIYPESPGFLPWGSDENGNYYGWLTDGPPDCWPVLSNEVRGHGYRRHNCSMTEYLAGVLHGNIRPLAGDYPTAEDMVFVG